MAECAAAHYNHTDPSPQTITMAHRDQLLFRIERAALDIDGQRDVTVILEGGDEAVANGVQSLTDMYPYQNAALARSHHHGSLEDFYGGINEFHTKENSQPGKNRWQPTRTWHGVRRRAACTRAEILSKRKRDRAQR
jgi:truncated hemoglobin YjbI